MRTQLKITVIAALFGLVATTTPTGAWGTNPSRTTHLTFNRPVALPGVQLDAGTYIFEVANPDTTANVVRVLNKDRSKIHLMAFTYHIQRPAGMRADQSVTFGEAPRGGAVPIKAWFPVGEQSGYQFIYRD